MNNSEDFRRTAPPPLPLKPLSIPEPFETSLSNGLRIVVVENSRLPLVSYRLAIRGGKTLDPKGIAGLSDMLANLLTEGTRSRTSRTIADEVAQIGATLTAGSNSDYLTVAASALSQFDDQILELLSDVVLNPSFPENELVLSIANTKQGLIHQRSDPSFLASERMSSVLFGTHPYSIVSPSNESLDAMTRDRFVEFHEAVLVPNRAVLVVVGDVKRDEVVRKVERLLGSWKSGSALTENFESPSEQDSRTAFLVDRPGSAQTNIVIANLAINRTDPDYIPMVVMNTVLGSNASSRLFMNLREEKGYTYGAYSSVDARRSAGSFRASAEVRAAVTGDSLKEFFYEFDRIRKEPASDKEIIDAKSYITGVFPIQIETQEGLINQLVTIQMYDLPFDYLLTYRERINAVTAEDIERVARAHITPDKAALVIVGDTSEIIDQVRPFVDAIEFYDTAGSKQESLDR